MKISLEKARVNSRLTQADVAHEMGVSLKTIQNWENGIYFPRIDQLYQLMEIYNVSVGDIFLPTKKRKV